MKSTIEFFLLSCFAFILFSFTTATVSNKPNPYVNTKNTILVICSNEDKKNFSRLLKNLLVDKWSYKLDFFTENTPSSYLPNDWDEKYDHLFIFSSALSSFPSALSSSRLTTFFDHGHNIMIFTDPERNGIFSSEVREFLLERGFLFPEISKSKALAAFIPTTDKKEFFIFFSLLS